MGETRKEYIDFMQSFAVDCSVHQSPALISHYANQLQALINTEVLKALDSIEVPEKIGYLQDSDGNYLDDKEPRAKIRVVYNEAHDQFTKAIKQVKEKYTV